MKYLPIAILFFCLSCKPEKSIHDTIKTNLENYFKPTLTDAASYEFVEITNLDTITEKEFVERVIDMLQMNLMNVDDRLKNLEQAESNTRKSLNTNPNDPEALLNLRDIQSSRSQIMKQQQELDSLKTSVNSADDHAIKFIQLNFTFKSENPKGESILHRYYVKLNEDLTVQSASEVRR